MFFLCVGRSGKTTNVNTTVSGHLHWTIHYWHYEIEDGIVRVPIYM